MEVDLMTELCLRIYGNAPERDILVTALSEVLDRKPELRTFSRLTSMDYEILCPSEAGGILVNQTKLREIIPLEKIPSEFWTCLQVIRSTNSRKMGAGVRQVIGHFLSYAVLIAREIFQENRLCVQHEYEVTATNIPGIGQVHGPLDFLTGRATGQLNMGDTTIDTMID